MTAPLQQHNDYIQAKERFAYLDQNGNDSDHPEMTELADAILAYERDVLGIEPLFRVHDEATLEWYVGRLADLESKKKRIQAQADAMIRDVERQAEGLRFRFGIPAERVLRGLLTGRRKSVKFLTGTIGVRRVAGRVGVEDQETLAAELPKDLLIEVSEPKIDSAALNKLIKVVDGKAYRVDTGEDITINGLKVIPESERVYVKVGDEE